MDGPGRGVVVGAVDAAVVLQEEPLGTRRVPGHLVHALAELGVLLALGQELGPDALVARRPRAAVVGGLVDAAGRDRDGHRRRVGRVRKDRVEGLAAEAGAPLGSLRVVPQGLLEGEVLAAVGRAPDGAGLGAGLHDVRLDARGPAARPARRWRPRPRGSGSRRRASPPRSRRGRRTGAPADRASSTTHPPAAGAASAGGVDHAGVDLLHVVVRTGEVPLVAVVVGVPIHSPLRVPTISTVLMAPLRRLRDLS